MRPDNRNRYKAFTNWLNKTALSNFTYSYYIPFLIFLLSIILGLLIFSILSIICSSNFTFNSNFEGFNKILIFFKFPIGLVAGLVVIITLLNSSIRYLQFEEQFKINRHNIYMNNYYKHLEEFNNLFFDLKDTILKSDFKNIRSLYKVFHKLNKQEVRELYYHWYGKKYASKHEILDNVKCSVREYYENILECKNKSELSNKKFSILKGIEEKLGFLSFSSRIYPEDTENLDYCYVYICEKILDFSDDDITNDKGESIRKVTMKHIDLL